MLLLATVRINADFSKVAVVHRNEMSWISSPESGVDRIMLDRIGAEVARATSIVRYAPGSSFARHEHAEGEEFLVLDGVFSDEHAHYAAGTYVRNPPGSGHSPFSESGCRILVKLRQFDANDLEHIVIDTNDSALWSDGPGGGIKTLALHRYQSETVQMMHLPANSSFETAAEGSEIFVVAGAISADGTELQAESWLRKPIGRAVEITAATDTMIWLKQGHLPRS